MESVGATGARPRGPPAAKVSSAPTAAEILPLVDPLSLPSLSFLVAAPYTRDHAQKAECEVLANQLTRFQVSDRPLPFDRMPACTNVSPSIFTLNCCSLKMKCPPELILSVTCTLGELLTGPRYHPMDSSLLGRRPGKKHGPECDYRNEPYLLHDSFSAPKNRE